jgi:hypothetical protein
MKPRKIKKPIVIGRQDEIEIDISIVTSIPTHHQCMTCPNYGVKVVVKGEGEFLDWFSPGSPVRMAQEPWPYTSKSPYCPICWNGIKEKHR